jgi:hypothetical protein
LSQFDQRYQKVDRQINIAAGEPKPDPAVLIERGVDQLRAGSYKLAADNFRQGLGIDPTIRRTYYYLPAALLRGRRPRMLVELEVREIDELLIAGIGLDRADGLLHWFRALLRDDYYNGNGLICPAPRVDELVAAATATTTDPGQLRTLLRDIGSMHDNRLHSELRRALSRRSAPG